MSHRDRDGHIAPGSHAQDLLTALDWLLTGTDLSSIGFRRDSSFSPRGLVLTALLWVWSDEAALTRRMAAARKIARRLCPQGAPQSVSYQAFLKRLVRWTAPLVLMLTLALRQRMQTSLKSHFRIAGFSVFGVDGSRLELPRTVSNEQRFSPRSVARKKQQRDRRKKRRGRRKGTPRRRSRRGCSAAVRARQAREKKADSPQLWLTTLWHAGTGLPWDWRTGPADSSERGHLREMIDALPEDALVTADAGFVGYDYWKALLDSGRQFLIRVGGNVRLLRELGYARESAGTVYLWPDREAKKHHPPLVLRLVRVQDGRQPWYLVTSVRDRSRLSDRQIAELYRRRWGIELFYRHFKQTFGRRKLRSHRADHAQCEADWSLVGLWAMLLYAAACLHRRRIPPERISVAGVLRAYRTALREYKSFPDPGESLPELLTLALLDEYVRKNKQSRDYPRKKYEPPTRPPEIRQATSQQIQLARQLTATIGWDRKGLTA